MLCTSSYGSKSIDRVTLKEGYKELPKKKKTQNDGYLKQIRHQASNCGTNNMFKQATVSIQCRQQHVTFVPQ